MIFVIPANKLFRYVLGMRTVGSSNPSQKTVEINFY